MNCIIVRYAEISLKGKNRIIFERRLVENIKDCLKQHNHPYLKIERLRNRIIIYTEKQGNYLRNVFGISSYSPATKTNADLDDIKKIVQNICGRFSSSTKFRITAKRLDKEFPLSSMELDKQIGSFVVEQTKAKVSLKDFDFEIGIELLGKSAYIFTERIPCFGGLPLGASGRAVAFIEGKNSLVAAWLMMRRGVLVYLVAKKEVNIGLLKKFGYGHDIKLKIVANLEEAEQYISQARSSALIVGDTLKTFKPLPTKVLVLRPLIGYDREHIIKLRRGLWNKG